MLDEGRAPTPDGECLIRSLKTEQLIIQKASASSQRL